MLTRFIVVQAAPEEKPYVLDCQLNKQTGHHPSRMEADIAADRLNRRSRVRTSLYAAIDHYLDGQHHRPTMGAALHLAGAMADLGAVAKSLHGGVQSAELEPNITELAARLVWWLEDIELTR